MGLLSTSDVESVHYEVRCPSCKVSFPVETRTCLHCGQRTVAPGETAGPSLRAQPTFDEAMTEFPPEASADPESAEEQELEPRSPFRLGMSAVWILLALIGSAYRVCSGG